MFNYVLVALTAFIGMYLLLTELQKYRWISAFIAFMFSQLPFFSVYGLSVMGQPLLFYACLRLWKKKEHVWISFVITAYFATFSSLILVGFADILLLIIFSLVLLLRKHSFSRYALIQTIILFGIYVILNHSLLRQILLPSDILTHKADWIATSKDSISVFKDIFLHGQNHAMSLHNGMLVWIFPTSVIGLIFYNRLHQDEKSILLGFYSLLLTALSIAGFCALWHSSPIVYVRNRLGGIFISFQADRIYWLYPAIWFILFGLMIFLIVMQIKRSVIHKILSYLLVLIIIGSTSKTIYMNSIFRTNMTKISAPRSCVSWDDFYSPELFQEIEEYIGLPQAEYKVGSVALYPSVPLYNGFYCIDGYSNNYDLEYKKNFRNIISKELEKSPSLQSYYDDWGNRCYLFSSEIGTQFLKTKYSTLTLENLELSADSLKDMECDYIFSGLEISTPSDSGLEFMESFLHEDSFYHIYVYRVL